MFQFRRSEVTPTAPHPNYKACQTVHTVVYCVQRQKIDIGDNAILGRAPSYGSEQLPTNGILSRSGDSVTYAVTAVHTTAIDGTGSTSLPESRRYLDGYTYDQFDVIDEHTLGNLCLGQIPA